MSADEDYTASEQLLLKQFGILDDIKKGKRPLNRTASELQQQSKPATTPSSASDTKGVTVSASGLKQPSKLRLKPTKPQSIPDALQPPPAASTAPAEPTARAAAPNPIAAAVKQEQVPAADPAPTATISREDLKARLAQQLAKQQATKQAVAAAATEEAAGSPTAQQAQAPTLAPVRSFREAHKARLQETAAPRTPTGAAVAGSPMSVQPQQQEHQPAPAPARAPAAAAVAKSEEVDYGAVSSPEYEVDYNAVSSPEYDGVSHQASTRQQQNKQQQQQPGQLPSQAPSTPEHKHTGRSPAGTPSTTTPPAAAKHSGATLDRPSARRPEARGAGSRSGSRSRHKDRDRCNRGARSRSRSRSPAARQERHSRSRSRSPDRHLPGHSQHSLRRSSSYRRSRSRSPEAQRHRSWTRSGSRSYHRPRAARSRSRSRSASSRGRSYGSRSHRASPDYGIGPGGVSVPIRSRSPDPAAAAAAPPPEEGEVEALSGEIAAADGSDGEMVPRSRGSSRAHKQQQQQQQGRTLFVGDLPAVGFTSTDLQGLFAAFGWNVVSARVMGSQCYGFVEFGTELEAEQALQLVQDKDPGFAINGTFIRASRAKGSMPRWKQGKAVLSKRDRGQGLEGLEAYEHPTARLVRLQAAAALAVAPQGAKDLDAAPAGLPIPVLAAPLLSPGAPSAPQSRAVIDYGDL